MSKQIPEIRFKDFTDEWEQRKFDEAFGFPVSTNSLSREKLNYEIGVVKSVHYGDILINYNTVLDVKMDIIPFITEGEISKYESNLLRNRDLVFADAAEDMSVGKAVEISNITTENVVAGLHTIVARAKIQKGEYFLGYYINSENYHRQLLRLIQGTKVSSISKGSLKETKVSMPKTLEEQEKIGNLFKTLDKTITLHLAAIQRQQRLKKAMLQKFFPVNGATIPAVRFSSFKEEWEQRKLGDESIISAGGDVKKDKLKAEGKYPVLANALTNEGILGYYDDEFRIEAPAVTVTGRGDVGYAMARKVNFTPVVRLLSVKSEHDVDFLENAINNHNVLVESTGVPQLTAPQLGNYKIYFPTLDEEKKIGAFFKSLDDAIALHHQALEKLKLLKQSLLQKIFI